MTSLVITDTQNKIIEVTNGPTLVVGKSQVTVLETGAAVAGADGADGADGQGVPTGGTTGQFLKKSSDTDYDTEWDTVSLSGYLTAANNLSDVSNNVSAVANLMPAVAYSASGTHITITATGAAVKPLVVKGASAHTVNLTEWQDSSGIAVAQISASGNLIIGTASPSSQAIYFKGSSDSNRFEIRDDNTSVYFQTYGNRAIYFQNAGGGTVTFGTQVTFSGGIGNLGDSVIFGGGSSAIGGMVYNRNTSNGATLQTYGGKPLYINPAGNGMTLASGNFAVNNGNISITNASAATIAFIVKGAASQSANLTEWHNSAGTVQLAVGPTGQIKTNQTSSGTTLGNVTDKMPVYDVAGTLVGYVPIYDSIT